MWYKQSVSDRMNLMKSYKKGGFSYSDMVKDYDDSYKKFEHGGEHETQNKPNITSEYKPKTKEEELFRRKMFNDSLELAKQTRATDWIYQNTNKLNKVEYDSLSNLESTYPQYNFINSQYDEDKKNKNVGEFKDYVQEYHLGRNIPGIKGQVVDKYTEKSITGRDLSVGLAKVYAFHDSEREKSPKGFTDKQGRIHTFDNMGDSSNRDLMEDVYDPQTETGRLYSISDNKRTLINVQNRHIKPTESLYRGNVKKQIHSELSLGSSSTGWYDATKPKPKFKETSNEKYISYNHELERKDLTPFPTQKILKADADAPQGEVMNIHNYININKPIEKPILPQIPYQPKEQIKPTSGYGVNELGQHYYDNASGDRKYLIKSDWDRQILGKDSVKKYNHGGVHEDPPSMQLPNQYYNPSENFNQQPVIDPYLRAQQINTGNQIQEQEKNALALDYYNKRKNQRMVGLKGSPSEIDQINRDVSEYSANNAIDYKYTPTGQKVQDFAVDMGLGMIGTGAYSILGRSVNALAKEEQVASNLSKFIPKQQSINTLDKINLPEIPKQAWSLAQPTENTLQIKSTMTGSPLEKQLSKTGEINVNSIKAHIGKNEVGQQDKYILDKVLNEKFAGKTKIDYNDFRKAVSEELVPLERNILSNYEHNNWGLDKLGYPAAKKSSYDSAIKHSKQEIDRLENLLKYKHNLEPTSWETADQIRKRLQLQLDETKSQYAKSVAEYENLPLENHSITYSNSSKFGRGSADHFDESTLGHARILVSKEEPDVMHTLEQQSDYWQKGKKTNLKILEDPLMKERNIQRLNNLEKSAKEDIELAKNMRHHYENQIPDSQGNLIHKSQVEQFENMANSKLRTLNFKKADLLNPAQKELLGNTHQERLLQENVAYAVEKSYSKIRYPTSETAVKIQGYKKIEIPADKNFVNPLTPNATDAQRTAFNNYIDALRKGDKPDFKIDYSSSHKTILKKYDEMPKIIKKVLNKETKIITDSKGNTWYEFDIPESFKLGKAEIKALSTVSTIGLGALSSKDILEKLYKKQ